MSYNGHKNWNHWNVSLWINNNERLHRMALEHLRNCSGSRQRAAMYMLDELKEREIRKTPDGAPYSVSSIAAAMRDM
jgi:hypothetical protein